jgi:hypothetical protein
MNKYAAVIAVVMFALGAVAGHSMTAQAPVNLAAKGAPTSAFELMRNAPAMLPDQTSDHAV